MEKKIIDIITISTSQDEMDKNHPWYPHSFNGLVEKLLKQGYVPFDEVKATYQPAYYTPSGAFLSGGNKVLTQQFVKYED